MSEMVVLAALVAFTLFLVPGQHRKYAAIAGWICIVLNLFLELPAFFSEANFLYPALAFLSVPFLIITVRHLMADDPVVLRFSTSAAVATIIYVPFAIIPILRDALIGMVINLVFVIVTALGHHPEWGAWDMIFENGFYNQIILGCTGILAIAMILGVIAGVSGPGIRQRFAVALLVVPVMFILNLFRVAGVFIAVSDTWFTGFPDPTGTGDANFFWAHNVVAEALAILFLLVLIVILGRALPGLWGYVRDVVNVYANAVRDRIKTQITA